MAPGIDAVLPLEWRGAVTARERLRRDVDRLRASRADVAVLLPHSFASAWLARSAAIGERWGYAADLRRALLTRAVRRPRRSLHQAAYYQTLVRELGMANGPLDPAVSIPAAALDAARTLLASRGWDGRRPLLAVAPGAAYGTAKRWLPRHFAALIEIAARERGMLAVLVGASADAETTRSIAAAVDGRVDAGVIDIAGATTLEMLAAVLALSAVCVSNDSGAMHLAGAVGVPLVALFGPTREYETAPLTRPQGRSDVLVNPVWCRPCMLRECPIDHRCLSGIEPSRVAAAVARMVHS
jgi:heptosyltransferase-2